MLHEEVRLPKNDGIVSASHLSLTPDTKDISTSSSRRTRMGDPCLAFKHWYPASTSAEEGAGRSRSADGATLAENVANMVS